MKVIDYGISRSMSTSSKNKYKNYLLLNSHPHSHVVCIGLQQSKRVGELPILWLKH